MYVQYELYEIKKGYYYSVSETGISAMSIAPESVDKKREKRRSDGSFLLTLRIFHFNLF